MEDLENKIRVEKLMAEAMKRDDKRYIPLMLDVATLSKYYPIDYILEKMKENYDGRETYFEKYGAELENVRQLNKMEVKNGF